MDNYFQIKLNGFDKKGLDAFVGKRLLSLKWPKQKLKTTGGLWRLQLYWKNGNLWKVDNVPMTARMKDGFEFDIGCISIENLTDNFECDDFERETINLNNFIIKECRIASACEEGNISECAIALIGQKGKELIISTAIPPTSISFSVFDRIETEFFISDLRWRKSNEKNPCADQA